MMPKTQVAYQESNNKKPPSCRLMGHRVHSADHGTENNVERETDYEHKVNGSKKFHCSLWPNVQSSDTRDNQREPRSGTGTAIPRCLQRFVRRHGDVCCGPPIEHFVGSPTRLWCICRLPDNATRAPCKAECHPSGTSLVSYFFHTSIHTLPRQSAANC